MNSTSSEWYKKGITNRFTTKNELKQVWGISPLLLAIFINDLRKFIGGGVKICTEIRNALLYADN